MLTIQKLSSINSRDITSLIFEFQQNHFKKYGNYYQLIPDAKDKIQKIIKSLINKRSYSIFAAYWDKVPIGYIFLKVDKNLPIYTVEKYGYISGLYIKPKFRKKGVASELVLAAEKWFNKKKIKRIELKVNVGNDDGMNFWKKNGFKDQQIIMIKDT
jgi:aminoglycoside 6'-N-acetyltransferase I